MARVMSKKIRSMGTYRDQRLTGVASFVTNGGEVFGVEAFDYAEELEMHGSLAPANECSDTKLMIARVRIIELQLPKWWWDHHIEEAFNTWRTPHRSAFIKGHNPQRRP